MDQLKNIFFILLFLPFFGTAQLTADEQLQIDSLEKIIAKANHDTIAINALIAWDKIIWRVDADLDIALNLKIDSICVKNLKKKLNNQEKVKFLNSNIFALSSFVNTYFNQGDYAKVIEYSIQNLKINEEIGDKKGIANSLYNIGISYYNQGDFTNAINYAIQSLNTYEEIGDKKGIATSLNNIGNIYYYQGETANAIDYYSKSLKIYEEIGDKEGISFCLNNIGLIYKGSGDYDKALDYHTQSLKICKEIGDKYGAAISLNSIGVIYKTQGDYDKAIDYYTQSLKLYEELEDKKGVAIFLNNIGAIYKEQGNYTKAIESYTQSLKIHEEFGDKKSLTTSLNNIGNIYQEQGDYAKALKFSKQALTIAQELGLAQETKNATEYLWEINKKLGRHKESLEMYELFISTRDSLESEANQKAVIQQEYKYKYEKQATADSVKNAANIEIKDAQLISDSKQRKLEREQEALQRYLLYSVLTIALLFGVFVFYRFRVTRKQKTILEITKNNELASSNLKALKSQMNPHFIFNSINSIQDLVLKQETLKSYDYLVVFSNLVRKILDFSEREFVPIEEEINFLNTYLGLEKLRFQDDFSYTITNNCKNKNQLIPSLIVQPFVENAIKHGLLHKEGKKVLDIEFSESDVFKCTVLDNGIGLTASKEIQQRQSPNHKSFAMAAVKNRLEILKNQMNGQAKYEMTEEVDLEGNVTGTKVEFTWRF